MPGASNRVRHRPVSVVKIGAGSALDRNKQVMDRSKQVLADVAALRKKQGF